MFPTTSVAVLGYLACFVSALSHVELTTSSRLGQQLVQRARSLNNNNNNNNNLYYGWMKDYSVKFDGCVAVPQYEREEAGFVRARILAKFRLCPTAKSCSSCSGSAGTYVVELNEFINTYQQAQYNAHQYACGTAKGECEYLCQNGLYTYPNGNTYQSNENNNNNNNNNCYFQCMQDQNMSDCVNGNNNNNNNNQNRNQWQELSECRAINGNNNRNGNNNNNNQQNSGYQVYYMGAHCTKNGVYAGIFTDSLCTKQASADVFEQFFGYSLPTDPLVAANTCVSCKQQSNQQNNQGNNNNNNNNDNGYSSDSLSESCDKLYQQSGRCETNIPSSENAYYTYTADTSGCDMIHRTLPSLNNALLHMSSGGSSSAATVWAWLFGVGFVMMGTYAFFLRRKLLRHEVSLLGGSA